MRIKCERCGGWVDEEFMHHIYEMQVCVLCSFQMQIPGWQEGPEGEEEGERKQ